MYIACLVDPLFQLQLRLKINLLTNILRASLVAQFFTPSFEYY
jgi:hypothetical protein